MRRASCLWVFLLALVALGVWGCEAKPEPAAPQPGPTLEAPSAGSLEGVGKERRYVFRVQLTPEQPRVGEMFVADTFVADPKTGEPVGGLEVVLDATMPEHRHGMMTKPTHKEVSPGRYQSQGMKLHMSGHWVFQVDAHGPGGDDTAKFDWQQSPRAFVPEGGAPASGPASEPSSGPGSAPGSAPSSSPAAAP